MNDHIYDANVKKALDDCIAELESVKCLYLAHPEKDFTRDRKITFKDFINICLQMESHALQNELLNYFKCSETGTPNKSAFCQQRAKVSSEAMMYLFSLFTRKLMELDAPETFKEYRLLACDGSDINIPYNPQDEETFHQIGDKKGYNQLHLNAFYDILNGIYIDCVLEPDRKSHERQAFITMVDRLRMNTPAIIMADRGYEGYNVFAHLLRSGQKFIIRLKDDNSNGIISTYDFHYDDNHEFDCDIDTILTWKQTNDIKAERQTYTYVARQKLDYYQDGDPFFPLSLRILCVEVAPGTFEYLATNLDRDEFRPEDIKELYHRRWGLESSFRDLKYTVDLVHFHGRKRNNVEQETWARLIVFNFCEAIVHHVAVTRQTKQSGAKKRKYDYKINFSTAVCICKAFLKESSCITNPSRIIGRFLVPIKPNRTAPRKVKPQSAKSFLYRAA